MSALLPTGAMRPKDDEMLLAESARQFLAERAPVSSHRALRDSNNPVGYSRELWHEMVGLGWAGVVLPESRGGSGLGLGGAAVLAEEMGRTLAASPFLSTAVLFALALDRHSTGSLRERWLPRVLDGTATGALAIDERESHEPSCIEMVAKRHGPAWTLDGIKVFVEDGNVADALLFAARVDGNGTALFLAERETPGLTVEHTRMVDSRNSCRVVCRKVSAVQASEVKSDSGVLDELLDAGRAVLAAELCGISRELFQLTVDHLNTRKQFGVPLSTFQALQHRLADLYSEIEMARSAVRGAVRQLDARSGEAPKFASVAKAKASTAATRAAAEAVQMHGGMGMTDELNVGLYLKRVRVACERYGDAHFHADRLGRLHGY